MRFYESLFCLSIVEEDFIVFICLVIIFVFSFNFLYFFIKNLYYKKYYLNICLR